MKGMLALFLAILVMPLSCMAEKTKDRYKGKDSVFVSYANAATNTDLETVFLINLGFNNDPNYHEFIMDTGSCGIVATPDRFTPGPGAINLGPGDTHYTDGSTSKVLSGTYWTATQQIYNEQGILIATSNVPVLQVTSESDNGGPPFTPSSFALMGIGFGREGSEIPPKTPAFNAFLNLTSILSKGQLVPLPANWVNGYIITPTGAILGLTAKNTKRAGFVKLTPWPQYSTPTLPEWMPMSMTVCVNGVCADGQSVMDTGIGNGIINPSPAQNLGTLVDCPNTTVAACVADGNVFTIYFPSNVDPVAAYTFTLGQTGNAMEPPSVAVQSRSTIFWNTGRHFIGGMNFVYDNTHGYAGFIFNGGTSHRFADVIPSRCFE